MHIVGVIIHGTPDRRYFFCAYPHLAGDSSLNVECIRRALVLYRNEMGRGLPPNLYLQLDSAADNKSRFVLGTLGWLVLQDLFHQVEVVMLPVGHTHEDIDQAFRVISEALDAAGFIGTLDDYLHIIRTAWAGETQHVEILSAVHDYKAWMQGHIWETEFKKDANTLKYITTARYFKIRRREFDRAVCLW